MVRQWYEYPALPLIIRQTHQFQSSLLTDFATQLPTNGRDDDF